MFTTVEKIIDFFNVNEEVFNQCIEELDDYNGYLYDDRYYPMDELDELHTGVELSEILRRAFFGYDEDAYTINSNGNGEYGRFNPNRKFFRYNGNGNLVSADYKDYSAHLDRYTIEAMSENRSYIDSIDNDEELTALFDELEQEENEEEKQ